MSLLATPAGAMTQRSAPSAQLALFVHPLHGGGWASHALSGVAAGVGAPSVAASSAGRLLIAQRAADGDVTVALGSTFGTFVQTDLTQTIGAPPAAGRTAAFMEPSGVGSVWYRTSTDDLEVLAEQVPGGAWSATDVTQAVVGSPLAGDPTVVAGPSRTPVGYAVTQDGIVQAYTPPTAALGVWTAADPTSGLTYPALTGDLVVLHAPGLASATVLLGVDQYGDVVELSDEATGSPPRTGAWQAFDLAAEGIPSAIGPLAAAGPSVPVVSYATWSGDVVSLELTSGLPHGIDDLDLTRVSDLAGAPGAQPSVVAAPGGPAIAERTSTGDLLLAAATTRTDVADVSFQAHTAELIGSDVGATTVGGATVLVAQDAGPIAPTSLGRRIALLAAAWDQQHRGFQTVPAGSDCNPFTASFGRGSSAGCPAGTSAEEWCSDFAQYVWRGAGVPTGGITGWSATFVQWGAAHHRVQWGTHFRAQVGDAIVWGTRSPLYGQHVGIIVSVLGSNQISVVSGNSYGDFPGYGDGVWRWGPFDGWTSTVLGYHVLGVVTP